MLVTNNCYWFGSVLLLTGLTIGSFDSDSLYRNKRADKKCALREFACRSGQCISKFDICDGRKDCQDGSDENHVTCRQLTCPKNTFKCAYGACIDGNKVCNGVIDCADKSDELQLSCPGLIWVKENATKKCSSEEFQCRNGQCIDRYAVCDGKPDCNDTSDETIEQCNREFFQCLSTNFRCAYGACVEGTSRCDGKKDCHDGSDEDDFLCRSKLMGDSGYEPITEIPVTPPSKPNITGLQCIVPDSTGTKYSLSECEDYDSCQAVQPNTVVDYSTTVMFINCKEGFGRPQDHYNFIFCDKGKWAPSKVSCVRLCKPLISTSMKTTCHFEGSVVDCNKGMRPGSTATSYCQTGYTVVGTGLYYDNTCLDNGNWIYPLQRCTHKCGILPTQSLIGNGVKANKTNHPWNGGIYYQLKNGTITHICGGTLITPFAVITAAHCVHTESGKLLAASKFKIGLGKEHRDYDHPDDNESAQLIDAENVYVSPIYDGQTLHYFSDVAIIELKSSARLTRFVMPICIDTQITFTLTTNTSIVSVVGWGLDALEGDPTPTLQRADLPYVSYNDCLKELAKINQQDVLTKDKFCAYFIDQSIKTSVHSGDSGAGLIHKYDGKYYIIGLVSTKVESFVNTFTDVRNEINYKFINNVVQNITRKHHL